MPKQSDLCYIVIRYSHSGKEDPFMAVKIFSGKLCLERAQAFAKEMNKISPYRKYAVEPCPVEQF